MNPRLLLFWLTLIFSVVGPIYNTEAQAPAAAATPAPTPLPANAMVTCAGGIQLTFIPGSTPILTAAATDATFPPGLAVATARTVRFVDNQDHDVDPASIKPTERLQPISGSGPAGLVLQKILVDRD